MSTILERRCYRVEQLEPLKYAQIPFHRLRKDDLFVLVDPPGDPQIEHGDEIFRAVEDAAAGTIKAEGFAALEIPLQWCTTKTDL
jgi:hypothetical protein